MRYVKQTLLKIETDKNLFFETYWTHKLTYKFTSPPDFRFPKRIYNKGSIINATEDHKSPQTAAETASPSI